MASRLVNDKDYSTILAALQDGVAELISSGTKPIAKAMDPAKAAAYLVQYNEHSYIVDETYLVCYQLGVPWFSEDLCLGEMTVARLTTQGGKFSAVTDFLKAEAERHGCKWVIAGTLLSSQDGLLSKLYERRGFSPSLRQLTLEVT